MAILHISNWYPNPWNTIEGNFVRDQIAVMDKEVPANVVVVQVRSNRGRWPRLARLMLDRDAQGYILHAPVRPGRLTEWLSTILLVGVLFTKRAWKYDALHFHIAYPLLMHSYLWKKIFRRPILISEHWTAYHFNFHLSEKSRAVARMRRPFQQQDVVLAVSKALLSDIQAFAQNNDFRGFVLPNVVPLHGPNNNKREVPNFFIVNVWRAIKRPMIMLEGLNKSALLGNDFNIIIGGYGDMIEDMSQFVDESALRGRVKFTGKLTKSEIATHLAESDGYLFSSEYETFSVACAEALGAGVPIIGPYIPAIAEYAGPEEWLEVKCRTPEAWEEAVNSFLNIWRNAGWDKNRIAGRAQDRFSEARLRESYRAIMRELGLWYTK